MQLRNKVGQFTKSLMWGFELTPARKVSGSMVLGISLIVGGGMFWEALGPTVLVASNVYADEIIQMPPTTDRLEEKVRQLKDEVLDSLAKCESGGRDNESGIIVWDTNNKPSLGKFQFQVATVQHYVEKRDGTKISGREAILLALDETEARKLAEWVIFDSGKGSASDWVICTRKGNLAEKQAIIKSLEN